MKKNLLQEPNKDTAKNTTLFVGDGMGITTITAARILEGQMRLKTGEENELSWEKFPWSAQSKTYTVIHRVQTPEHAQQHTCAELRLIKVNAWVQPVFLSMALSAHTLRMWLLCGRKLRRA